ncbi:hypothetical protein D3C84_768470 [compost metagenome]
MMVILFMFKLILAGYFLKSGIKKTIQIYDFYSVIVEYQVISRRVEYLAVLLIALEIMTALALILSMYGGLYIFIGGLLQFMYLYIQLKGIGKSMQNNCNCFEISVPKSVTSKTIMINLALLLALIILYSISLRL